MGALSEMLRRLLGVLLVLAAPVALRCVRCVRARRKSESYREKERERDRERERKSETPCRLQDVLLVLVAPIGPCTSERERGRKRERERERKKERATERDRVCVSERESVYVREGTERESVRGCVCVCHVRACVCVCHVRAGKGCANRVGVMRAFT